MTRILSLFAGWAGRLRGGPLLLVAAAAGLAQANTLKNLPVLDDGWVIFENPVIRSLANVGRIFREPYNVAGVATNAGLWRPVTSLTYALNWALGGPDVLGFHLVNAALHVLVSVLVFLLARRIVSAFWPEGAGTAALAAGLLFALHPVHVEAVAGMVGRAELLAAAGALGSLLLALGAPRGRWRLLAAAPVLAAGVLSKENAAIAPLLYLLVVALVPAAAGLPTRPDFGSRKGRAALGVALLPFAVLALGALIPWSLRPGGSLGVPAHAAWFGGQSAGVVAGTMSRALAEYLRLLVFPHPLGVDFYYSTKIPFMSWATAPALFSAVIWGGALAGLFALRRRAPVVALGGGWVFAALLPVSNLLPTGALMGERLLYLPSVGFCLMAGWGFAWAVAGAKRRYEGKVAEVVALHVAGAIVLGLLAWKTVQRNSEWQSPRTLWEAELVKSPRDPVVNNNLAVALTGAGEFARARERLEVVIAVAPFYWRAYVNLGILQHKAGDIPAALQSFDKAAGIDKTAPSPHTFAGLALSDAGRIEEAAQRFATAVKLAPEDFWPRLYLGRTLLKLGRSDEARVELERAVALDSRNAEARSLLAGLASR